MKPLRTTLIAAASATVLLTAATGCSSGGDDSAAEENGSQSDGGDEEELDLAAFEGNWQHLIPQSDSGSVRWTIDAEGHVETMNSNIGEEPALDREGQIHELRDGNIVITLNDVETNESSYLMLEPTDDPDVWDEVDTEATFERES